MATDFMVKAILQPVFGGHQLEYCLVTFDLWKWSDFVKMQSNRRLLVEKGLRIAQKRQGEATSKLWSSKTVS